MVTAGVVVLKSVGSDTMDDRVGRVASDERLVEELLMDELEEAVGDGDEGIASGGGEVDLSNVEDDLMRVEEVEDSSKEALGVFSSVEAEELERDGVRNDEVDDSSVEVEELEDGDVHDEDEIEGVEAELDDSEPDSEPEASLVKGTAIELDIET